jgi:hypothetical protein
MGIGRQESAGFMTAGSRKPRLETWARLLRMSDELVVERKQIGVDAEGTFYWTPRCTFEFSKKFSPTVGVNRCRRSILTLQRRRRCFLLFGRSHFLGTPRHQSVKVEARFGHPWAEAIDYVVNDVPVDSNLKI